jgi:hypothetical protein
MSTIKTLLILEYQHYTITKYYPVPNGDIVTIESVKQSYLNMTTHYNFTSTKV